MNCGPRDERSQIVNRDMRDAADTMALSIELIAAELARTYRVQSFARALSRTPEEGLSEPFKRQLSAPLLSYCRSELARGLSSDVLGP